MPTMAERFEVSDMIVRFFCCSMVQVYGNLLDWSKANRPTRFFCRGIRKQSANLPNFGQKNPFLGSVSQSET